MKKIISYLLVLIILIASIPSLSFAGLLGDECPWCGILWKKPSNLDSHARHIHNVGTVRCCKNYFSVSQWVAHKEKSHR